MSKNTNNSANNNDAAKTLRIRYVYRAICSVVLTLVALIMFLIIWTGFVSLNNHTGFLMGIGNLSLASILYVVIFAFIGRFLKAFKIGVERKARNIASIILTSCLTDFIEIFVSITILNDFRYVLSFAVRYVFLAFCQSAILSFIIIVMVDLYRVLVKPLPVVIIYGGPNTDIQSKICKIPNKYDVRMSIRYDDPGIDLEDIVQKCVSVLIDDVPASTENEIVKLCFKFNKRVYVVPKLSDIILKSSDSLNVIDTPLYLNRNLGLSLGNRFLKRFFDIILSGLALIILSPVLLITMLAIKIEDGGPVFFKQERVTKNGKHFMILKFRSMIVDAEKDGRPHPAGEKDDRITKVGKVIRACRMDELPQLINILRGDMSIVGPRPERYEHVEKYTRDIPEFAFREKVKGGLTGYAQVYGKYNTSALDKLKMDVMYITNYSLLLDLQIILETIKVLLQKESTEGFSESNAQSMHDYDVDDK